MYSIRLFLVYLLGTLPTHYIRMVGSCISNKTFSDRNIIFENILIIVLTPKAKQTIGEPYNNIKTVSRTI